MVTSRPWGEVVTDTLDVVANRAGAASSLGVRRSGTVLSGGLLCLRNIESTGPLLDPPLELSG